MYVQPLLDAALLLVTENCTNKPYFIPLMERLIAFGATLTEVVIPVNADAKRKNMGSLTLQQNMKSSMNTRRQLPPPKRSEEVTNEIPPVVNVLVNAGLWISKEESFLGRTLIGQYRNGVTYFVDYLIEVNALDPFGLVQLGLGPPTLSSSGNALWTIDEAITAAASRSPFLLELLTKSDQDFSVVSSQCYKNPADRGFDIVINWFLDLKILPTSTDIRHILYHILRRPSYSQDNIAVVKRLIGLGLTSPTQIFDHFVLDLSSLAKSITQEVHCVWLTWMYEEDYLSGIFEERKSEQIGFLVKCLELGYYDTVDKCLAVGFGEGIEFECIELGGLGFIQGTIISAGVNGYDRIVVWILRNTIDFEPSYEIRGKLLEISLQKPLTMVVEAMLDLGLVSPADVYSHLGDVNSNGELQIEESTIVAVLNVVAMWIHFEKLSNFPTTLVQTLSTSSVMKSMINDKYALLFVWLLDHGLDPTPHLDELVSLCLLRNTFDVLQKFLDLVYSSSTEVFAVFGYCLSRFKFVSMAERDVVELGYHKTLRWMITSGMLDGDYIEEGDKLLVEAFNGGNTKVICSLFAVGYGNEKDLVEVSRKIKKSRKASAIQLKLGMQMVLNALLPVGWDGVVTYQGDQNVVPRFGALIGGIDTRLPSFGARNEVQMGGLSFGSGGNVSTGFFGGLGL
ncbi:hypothetical protein HDU76_005537 [Blyttiomyces sp. JEL0837]|nr:hypothetical protein HDU76_005537 [Blyttiomyces sp. JEL0837]